MRVSFCEISKSADGSRVIRIVLSARAWRALSELDMDVRVRGTLTLNSARYIVNQAPSNGRTRQTRR